jgi:hypothetical protein
MRSFVFIDIPGSFVQNCFCLRFLDQHCVRDQCAGPAGKSSRAKWDIGDAIQPRNTLSQPPTPFTFSSSLNPES